MSAPLITAPNWLNQMSIKIQMDKNNCSRKYYIAMKMNKILLYGTTWINLDIIMLV